MWLALCTHLCCGCVFTAHTPLASLGLPHLGTSPPAHLLSSNRPLQVREPNLKYLALENMARLAEVPAVVDTGGCCSVHLGWLGRAVGWCTRPNCSTRYGMP